MNITSQLACALWSCNHRISLAAFLNSYAATHGSAAGLWHVIVRENQWVFATEQEARSATAYLLRSARWCAANEFQSRRIAVRRLHPPRKIRVGERSYRGYAAGAQWDVWNRGWLRLFQRTEEMERGRLAQK